MGVMVRAENLGKQFDDFWALRDVNLEVRAGEVLALLGPNGAGKTTTVRILTSILRPTRGSAQVGGYDVIVQPHKVREIVGVLTEHHGLYGRMPADEYLDFFAQIYGLEVPERQRRVQDLLALFNLRDVAQERISEFSKGMRQKLSLARALIHSPPVLLLDEPTSAMDPESARLVREAIQELRSTDRAIVICTHNLAEAEELADRIAIIRKGNIIADGSLTELKRQFLGLPEYEVVLGNPLDGYVPELPCGVSITAQGPNWLRFSTLNPKEDNPILVRNLMEHGLPVVELREVLHSLEKVYLQVMNASVNREGGNVS
ncbi:MAG: ABC transporter ATP-binding protein [Chloroflexota bacterium]